MWDLETIRKMNAVGVRGIYDPTLDPGPEDLLEELMKMGEERDPHFRTKVAEAIKTKREERAKARVTGSHTTRHDKGKVPRR